MISMMATATTLTRSAALRSTTTKQVASRCISQRKRSSTTRTLSSLSSSSTQHSSSADTLSPSLWFHSAVKSPSPSSSLAAALPPSFSYVPSNGVSKRSTTRLTEKSTFGNHMVHPFQFSAARQRQARIFSPKLTQKQQFEQWMATMH